MTREQLPGLLSHFRRRLFDAEHRTAAGFLAKGNGYGLAQALGHERHRLRENEVRGDQHRGAAFEKRPGMQVRRISPVRQRKNAPVSTKISLRVLLRKGSLRSSLPQLPHRPPRSDHSSEWIAMGGGRGRLQMGIKDIRGQLPGTFPFRRASRTK